jgi:CRP-like cAMP-binding protein
MVSDSPIQNKLLAALPSAEYERLLPKLERVRLPLNQILFEPNQPLQYAYFPLDGVICLFNVMEGGQRIRAATIGNEGMVGVPLILGTGQTPLQAAIQISGEALRIEASAFGSEVHWGSPLYTLLLRYTQTLMGQISQMVTCNQLHSPEERFCYLLAMIQDWVSLEELPLTQEALSLLVGTPRVTIRAIAITLERAGLIRYQRGKITILDRSGLEAAACDCYRIVKAEFDRLFNP